MGLYCTRIIILDIIFLYLNYPKTKPQTSTLKNKQKHQLPDILINNTMFNLSTKGSRQHALKILNLEAIEFLTLKRIW